MNNNSNAQNAQREQNDKFSDAAKANVNKAADQGKQFVDVAQGNATKIADLQKQTAEQTKRIMQDGIQTASDQARAVTERLSRSFGFTGEDGERFAQQSKQNIEAVTRCGTVLTQAFQDVSRSWFELSQKQFQRNLEGATKLARAKSVQEFSAIQSDLVRESLEQMVQGSRTVAEKSLHAVDEAGKVFSSVTQTTAQAR